MLETTTTALPQDLVYRTIQVPVSGGELTVGIFGYKGPKILVSHGITSNHLAFIALAKYLATDCTLIVPDHRGRGGSNAISGPWGMKQHAEDLISVLDALKIERVPLHIGHSMGAFIGVVTKALYPQRIGSLLLVDGGLPLTESIPEGLTPEQLIHAVVGPAMERLDMNFADEDAYINYWKAHPALGQFWSDDLDPHFIYDLQGEPPKLRSRVNKAAIVGDTQSQLMSDDVGEALAQLTCPLHLLLAPRGVFNEAPLYSDARIEQLLARYDNLMVQTLNDVNHYTIGMLDAGARQVASYVRERLLLEPV